jgi:hypothetical protein
VPYSRLKNVADQQEIIEERENVKAAVIQTAKENSITRKVSKG